MFRIQRQAFSITITVVFIHAVSIVCAQDKKMALTFDDLPAVSTVHSLERYQHITRGITTTLKSFKAPAIGFVNEVKLEEQTVAPKAEFVNLLKSWVEVGLELGNHTYSHIDYNRTTVENFELEILNGEIITNQLTSHQSNRIKYFRHPYLHKGDTPDKKQALTKLLEKHRYQEAPVSIDNSDWIFARAYDISLSKGDTASSKKIGKAYVEYMMDKVHYFEDQSQKLLSRNIAHTLLLHANTLNADYLDELMQAIRNDNYTFVSLTEALQDKAYQQTETFAGRAGISWIHRWAISQNKPRDFFAGEPRCPEFILLYAGIESE